MKNVQIIDGAQDCEYAIYSFSDEQFALLFPANGQDVEFIDDAVDRMSEEQTAFAFEGVWMRKIDKKNVIGIHGTLFYELEYKKLFYPSKRENEMWDGHSVKGQPVITYRGV